MLLKIKLYLSAYNEYCEVSVEGAYINIKLIIGNRESGTGNCSLFLILVYNTKVLKVQIGNKESVPGSFLTIIGFILVSVFVNCISM